ncbi:Aegerolysin-domain-containing protein [Amanita rubescens]|nr:Aegerolysin-domain-containing protein [Amanita rubescens]
MPSEQWIALAIGNQSREDIEIRNPKIVSGMFYEYGTDGEIPPSQYDGQIIRPGSFLISACGRSDPPSGTEGSFDLQEARTGRIIAHISWDGALGGTNKLEASASDDDWQVQAQRPPSTGAPRTAGSPHWKTLGRHYLDHDYVLLHIYLAVVFLQAYAVVTTASAQATAASGRPTGHPPRQFSQQKPAMSINDQMSSTSCSNTFPMNQSRAQNLNLSQQPATNGHIQQPVPNGSALSAQSYPASPQTPTPFSTELVSPLWAQIQAFKPLSRGNAVPEHPQQAMRVPDEQT